MNRQKLTLLDSTLREGAQSEGISFSVADKLSIARELDSLGVTYIEAGNPRSNPKDREFFARAGELKLVGAQLAAFGSTRRKGVPAEEDEGLAALLAAGTPVVTLFGKCSRLHAETILGVSAKENADMIESSCRFISEHGRRVMFDAEHFFDCYAEDSAFAVEMLQAALRGGARTLVLCDTNGGAFPDDIARIVAQIHGKFPGTELGIHCHNDSGMAVANTVSAVIAGAAHVQGTLLGIGERCGNAALSAVIPNLQLKRGFSLIPDERIGNLTAISRAVAEICNVSIKKYEPYIGRSAFAHKAGMHVDAVHKQPSSYEHIPPETVGNERRILIGDISGRSALLDKLHKLLPDADKDSEITARVTERLKQLEHEGYQFEGAQASLELMIRRCIGRNTSFFELRNYRIICNNPHDPECSAAAMVKVRVGESEVLRSAEGLGPVHALDKALRLALSVFYPQLSSVRLSDYKVRVMDSASATAALVRVSIASTDGRREWSTVGVSQDIIEASFTALCDSIEYKLYRDSDAGRLITNRHGE